MRINLVPEAFDYEVILKRVGKTVTIRAENTPQARAIFRQIRDAFSPSQEQRIGFEVEEE